MDKYEYKIRSEEIKTLIAEGAYAEAAEIADTIDWRRVKSVMMLCTVSDLYKVNRRYEDAKNMLLLAYEKKPGGRTICYSLCELCIKTEEFVQAVNYYNEFTRVAPKDPERYILQYKLYEAQNVNLEERIGVLEELKKRDYREKWAYELAYLYHRVGLATRCVEECDELILWFGEGKYVVKAMELKMLHQPLTYEQQEAYDHRFDEYVGEVPEQYAEDAEAQDYVGQDIYEGQTDEALPYQGDDYGEQEAAWEEQDRSEEPMPEEMDIQVKTMDVGKYNTINLQEELAAGLQEVLGAEGVGSYGGDAYEGSVPDDDNMEETEVFFGETGEIDEAGLEAMESGAAGQDSVDTETEAEEERDIADTGAAADGGKNSFPAENGEAVTEGFSGKEELPETEPEDKSIVIMNQIREETMGIQAQPPKELEDVLLQETDGQISMVLPERTAVERQITGQMKIDDILAEWERMKKENEEKCKEEVRQHVLRQTGPMFTEFEAAVRDGLLERLEGASRQRPSSGHGKERPGAEARADGRNGPEEAGETVYAENNGVQEPGNPEYGGMSGWNGSQDELIGMEDAEYPEEDITEGLGAEGTVEWAGDENRFDYADEPVTWEGEAADDFGYGEAPEWAEEPGGEPSGWAEEPGGEPSGWAEEPGGEPSGWAEASDGGAPEYGDMPEWMSGEIRPEYIEEGYEGEEAASDWRYEDGPEWEQDGKGYVETPVYAEEAAGGDAEDGEGAEWPDGAAGYTEAAEYIEGGNAEARDGLVYADAPEYEDEGIPDLPEYGGEDVSDLPEYEGEDVSDLPEYEDEGISDLPEYEEEDISDLPGYEEGDVSDVPGYKDKDISEAPEYEEEDMPEDGGAPEYADEMGMLEEADLEGEEPSEALDYLEALEHVEEAEILEKQEGKAGRRKAPGAHGHAKAVSEKEAPEGAAAEEKSAEAGKEGNAEGNTPKPSKALKAAESHSRFVLERDKAKVRSMTREEKELFAPFIQNRQSREQLVKAIDGISMAAYTGNVVVTGEEGMDTLTLAKNLIRDIRMTDSNFSGKVAKITGAGLNRKNVREVLEGLNNGALIIQKASGMDSNTAGALHIALQQEKFGIIVIMEDTKKAVQKLFLGTPQLFGDFTARVDLEALSNDTLVAFGRRYAQEKEYSIDDLGMLALHTRIEESQTIDHVVTVIEVKQIVDEAIRHANRKTIGHFFDILLARRYDDEDMIILTEKDFVA